MDNESEIKKFLENIPDKFQMIEVGIDMEVQMEYLEYSHSFDRGELTERETENLGGLLFRTGTPLEAKKKVLTLLAHLGTIHSYKILSMFAENPDAEIDQWAVLALLECRMFLESELSDQNQGIILTGLGSKNNKMRCYFLVLPIDENTFSASQHLRIKNELSYTAKDLECDIGNVEFQDHYVSLTVLIPMDVAIATFIEEGIKNCNEFGNFVLKEYYVTNMDIPDKDEIEKILKIVKSDENIIC